MKTEFQIDPACRDLLEKHQLDDFLPWMSGEIGELVSKSGASEVRRVIVGDEVFFLKRRTSEPVMKLLGLLLFGRRPMSGPIRELHLVRALERKNFPVMKPVAWGESRAGCVPRQGFLVVRAIPGRSFSDLYDECAPADRPDMMARLGALLGKLHACGFFQHLRLKDLIETPDGQLTIIDRESGQPWARRFSVSNAVTSLARTARRTLRDGHVMGPATTGAFLRGYRAGVSGRWQTSQMDLARLILKRMRRDSGS